MSAGTDVLPDHRHHRASSGRRRYSRVIRFPGNPSAALDVHYSRAGGTRSVIVLRERKGRFMATAARERLAEMLGGEAAPAASSVQLKAKTDDLHLEVQ